MTEYTDIDVNKTTKLFFETEHGKQVEFVKVVRCENCRWYHVGEEMCLREGFPADKDDFCSWGEWKDD